MSFLWLLLSVFLSLAFCTFTWGSRDECVCILSCLGFSVLLHSEGHLYTVTGESPPLSLNNISSSFFLFFPLEFLLHVLDISFYLHPLTYPHFFHLVHCSVFWVVSLNMPSIVLIFFLSFLIIKALCLLPIPPSCLFLIHCILLSPGFCFLYYFFNEEITKISNLHKNRML